MVSAASISMFMANNPRPNLLFFTHQETRRAADISPMAP